jgi:hypothetical protein
MVYFTYQVTGHSAGSNKFNEVLISMLHSYMTPGFHPFHGTKLIYFYFSLYVDSNPGLHHTYHCANVQLLIMLL